MSRHWVATVRHDLVRAGVAGGFTEADDGGDTRLRRLDRGDGLVLYSPREAADVRRPLQCLTALGAVADDEPHRDAGTGRWRRRVDFETVRPVPIRPLLPLLGYLRERGVMPA